MFGTLTRLEAIITDTTFLKHDLTELRTATAKLVSAYTALQHKFTSLEQHLAQERKDDRQFLLSIVQMLVKTGPSSPILVSPHIDPFEELPVGHKDGYTAEELGLHDNSSETTQ